MRFLAVVAALLILPLRAHALSDSGLSQAAAAELALSYDSAQGRWSDVNWWQSAVAVTALIDHMKLTGDRRYLDLAAETFRRNLSYEFGHFRADSTDDTAWWALASIDMYDLTGEPGYLALAREDEAYIRRYQDDTCGGGVWWDTARTYKNAISNELYLELTAALHNRIPGDRIYLGRARRIWTWFSASGLINNDHLVNDGLTSACTNNGGDTFSYNQGVVLGGLVELAAATNDTAFLDQARSIADAAAAAPGLSRAGILTDPCEIHAECRLDGAAFKGIFVRNLGVLNRVLPGRPYDSYLSTQAASVIAQDRDGDRYGLYWAGPFALSTSASQQSVLDLFDAMK